MKKLLSILLIAALASCHPSKYLECPKYVGVVFSADTLPPCKHKLPNCKCLRLAPVNADSLKAGYTSTDSAVYVANNPQPDTTCEWMHISTREPGFVMVRKAVAVRRNGYCIAHLQGDKNPFPAHWHVGWCEGRDSLLNRLTKQRDR